MSAEAANPSPLRPQAKVRDAKVQLWLLNQEQTLALAPRAPELLSQAELDNAPSLQEPHRLALWEGRQVALRLILAERLEVEPEEIVLVRDERGKPRVLGRESLRFSESSSEGWWLAGLSDEEELGLGLAVPWPVEAFQTAVQVYLSRAEQEALNQAPDWQRLRLFYHARTRQEALFKLKGQGISGLVEQRCVEAQGVWMDDLDLGPELCASLALPKEPYWILQRHGFRPEEEREAAWRAGMERVARPNAAGRSGAKGKGRTVDGA